MEWGSLRVCQAELQEALQLVPSVLLFFDGHLQQDTISYVYFCTFKNRKTTKLEKQTSPT